jgi:hypothetical protein
MRIYLAVALWLIIFGVFYAATAAEAEKEYRITLTGPELSYIAKLLQKQPYEEVVGVIDKIRFQVTQPDPSPPMSEPPHPAPEDKN